MVPIFAKTCFIIDVPFFVDMSFCKLMQLYKYGGDINNFSLKIYIAYLEHKFGYPPVLYADRKYMNNGKHKTWVEK